MVTEHFNSCSFPVVKLSMYMCVCTCMYCAYVCTVYVNCICASCFTSRHHFCIYIMDTFSKSTGSVSTPFFHLKVSINRAKQYMHVGASTCVDWPHLWHVVAGVDPASGRVDSAVLSEVVTNKVLRVSLDLGQTLLLPKGGHDVMTVQLYM